MRPLLGSAVTMPMRSTQSIGVFFYWYIARTWPISSGAALFEDAITTSNLHESALRDSLSLLTS
jgi:hypothetical protein